MYTHNIHLHKETESALGFRFLFFQNTLLITNN